MSKGREKFRNPGSNPQERRPTPAPSRPQSGQVENVPEGPDRQRGRHCSVTGTPRDPRPPTAWNAAAGVPVQAPHPTHHPGKPAQERVRRAWGPRPGTPWPRPSVDAGPRRHLPPSRPLPVAAGGPGRASRRGKGGGEASAAWAAPHLASPGGGPLRRTRCPPPVAAGEGGDVRPPNPGRSGPTAAAASPSSAV